MNVRVSGKQFEIGEALPEQVRRHSQSAIEGFFGAAAACRGFDAALARLQKQLKRYKRRLKNYDETTRAPKAQHA